MAKTSLLTFNLDSNVQKLKAMKNVVSVKKIPSHLESVCFRTKCCYFASRICVVLENYQISQTEPNAGNANR